MDQAGRQRLRVVMWGSMIGFGHLFLDLIEILGLEPKPGRIADWLDFTTLFTLPLIPLCFACAIFRHRVIPISLILRRRQPASGRVANRKRHHFFAR